MASGKINVSVENIFPLIKKISLTITNFPTRMVSNATDATLNKT
jgi:hypothetical protein